MTAAAASRPAIGPSDAVGTVLVTGGSGYVAGELIRQLVAGGWRVHATVRDRGREPGLRRVLAVDDGRLRLFEADLVHDRGWDEASAGCTHVAHVASPLPTRAADDAGLEAPARDGTLRVLRSARAAGVRRIVMTSSIAAIVHGHPPGRRSFDEGDWTRLDGADVTPYIRSKTVAERAARDWIDAEGGDMAFCTVNPSMVIGPVMDADFSGSMHLVKAIVDGTYRGSSDAGFGIVDVRDVAAMHVALLTRPGVAGERVIASGAYRTVGDIARVLHARLDARIRLPQDPDAATEPYRRREPDARHAADLLGWHARDVDRTIVDAAHSLIDQGFAGAA